MAKNSEKLDPLPSYPIERDSAYIYFIDKEGYISRSPRRNHKNEASSNPDKHGNPKTGEG